MAKRTAKQKAATRKLVAFNKAKGKKRSPKKIKTKVIKTAKKRKSKSRSKKSTPSFFGGGLMNKLLTRAIPFGYGMIREKIANRLAKTALGKTIPGRYADQALFLALNLGATALGGRKTPLMRKVLQTHEAIEWYESGQETVQLIAERRGQSTGNAVNGSQAGQISSVN